MHGYRIWQPTDLPWLDQAAGAAAWESLSPAEQVGASPSEIGQRAAARTREVLQSQWGTAIVAHVGIEPVGYALVSIAPDGTTDEPSGVLMDLWVDPRHRQQKVGSTLHTLSEGLFTRLGLRKAKMVTGIHSLPALSFAAHRGYTAEGLLAIKAL